MSVHNIMILGQLYSDKGPYAVVGEELDRLLEAGIKPIVGSEFPCDAPIIKQQGAATAFGMDNDVLTHINMDERREDCCDVATRFYTKINGTKGICYQGIVAPFEETARKEVMLSIMYDNPVRYSIVREKEVIPTMVQNTIKIFKRELEKSKGKPICFLILDLGFAYTQRLHYHLNIAIQNDPMLSSLGINISQAQAQPKYASDAEQQRRNAEWKAGIELEQTMMKSVDTPTIKAFYKQHPCPQFDFVSERNADGSTKIVCPQFSQFITNVINGAKKFRVDSDISGDVKGDTKSALDTAAAESAAVAEPVAAAVGSAVAAAATEPKTITPQMSVVQKNGLTLKEEADCAALVEEKLGEQFMKQYGAKLSYGKNDKGEMFAEFTLKLNLKGKEWLVSIAPELQFAPTEKAGMVLITLPLKAGAIAAPGTTVPATKAAI